MSHPPYNQKQAPEKKHDAWKTTGSFWDGIFEGFLSESIAGVGKIYAGYLDVLLVLSNWMS